MTAAAGIVRGSVSFCQLRPDWAPRHLYALLLEEGGCPVVLGCREPALLCSLLFSTDQQYEDTASTAKWGIA